MNNYAALRTEDLFFWRSLQVPMKYGGKFSRNHQKDGSILLFNTLPRGKTRQKRLRTPGIN